MAKLNNINTKEDVASYLQVSTWTVGKLIREGKLKKITVLGKTRITKEAVEELINM